MMGLMATDTKFFALSKKEASDIWAAMSGAEREVLMQLRTVTWDGNLASKVGRSELVVQGYAHQYEGFQVISSNGLILLQALGKLEALTR